MSLDVDPRLVPDSAPSAPRAAPGAPRTSAGSSVLGPLRVPDVAAARELGKALGVSPTIAQVLLFRGLGEAPAARDWLDPRLSGLTPPDAMADRTAAADRLAHACRKKERVAIFGDYDVDGSTSTAILSLVLESLGCDVRALVANRFAGGYGLSDPALDRVLETGATLLITCDCGSSDHERVARAKARGLDVIVVDHHLVPKEPLPALAFLNPHRPDCGFPYKGLCSAGLALSVVAAVRQALGATFDLRPLLDLVALGTIADVAPLDGDNRRLTRYGLQLLSSTPRPGLSVLRDLARVRAGQRVGAIDVAFRFAPRLNAAGRLGDPAITLALLRAKTLEEARPLAARIDELNTERREIQRRVTEEAIAEVRRVSGAAPPAGIVVSSERWHRGVVGIVAARLVEVFDAPSIVIAMHDGVGHGSGRAPAGFPLYDAIARCRADLETFGGHSAAAGVTVRAERLDAFSAAFADTTRSIRSASGAGPTVRPIDVRIDGDAFDLPTATELGMLEPVGHGNAEPRFSIEDAPVERAESVGEGHLKLVVRVGRAKLSCFGYDLGHELERIGSRVSVVGALRADSWRGGEAVELRLEHVAPIEAQLHEP